MSVFILYSGRKGRGTTEFLSIIHTFPNLIDISLGNRHPPRILCILMQTEFLFIEVQTGSAETTMSMQWEFLEMKPWQTVSLAKHLHVEVILVGV